MGWRQPRRPYPSRRPWALQRSRHVNYRELCTLAHAGAGAVCIVVDHGSTSADGYVRVAVVGIVVAVAVAVVVVEVVVLI